MTIKDFFESEWAGVAGAWVRWQEAVRTQSAAATRWIIELADIRAGLSVLDLASGVGDPAVTLARRVGPNGRVVATDLVAGTLEFVDEAARAEQLGQLTTRRADMEALPFASESFDAVTCRLGLMFCPRPDLALAEVRRVLRPGGKASFIVWGDARQPLFAATLGEIGRAFAVGGAGDEEASAPDAPGPFRFADPGRLSAALARAGFSGVLVEEKVIPWPFAGSGAEMWQMFYDLGGPSFQRRIAALDADVRRALADRIAARLETHRSGVALDPTARLLGSVGTAP
jgi:ubiquinone/menaquinone biosynthesis C-methylase UbiE